MDDFTARDFGRLEGKVDAIYDAVADLKQSGTDTHNDFEDRIRGLEKWRWGIPGSLLAALIGFFLG